LRSRERPSRTSNSKIRRSVRYSNEGIGEPPIGGQRRGTLAELALAGHPVGRRPSATRDRLYAPYGPKYEINIEGVEYAWDKDTITVPEIRSLGGIPEDQQIVEVFDDNSEQTLAEDAVIAVKPGKGFGKKVKFQRG
jgi:hypothetical protein